MKKITLTFIFSCTFQFISLLQAQTSAELPHSTHADDQLVQGPCYIFATLAALETKALQDNTSIDASSLNLFEWNNYSAAVLGSTTGGGNMVSNTLTQAKNHGIYFESGNASPDDSSFLPNLNGSPTGIADFTSPSCSSNTSVYFTLDSNGTCTELNPVNPQDPKKFISYPLSGGKLILNSTSQDNGYFKNDNPTTQDMKNALNNQHGLIAFFDNWVDDYGTNTNISHAVFIYGYNGNKWMYKDSWPGQAGLKEKSIIPSCTTFYYLTGGVSPENNLSCNGDISGPTTINGIEEYTLENTSNVSNIVWEVPQDVSITNGQGTNKITVKRKLCADYSTDNTVSVSYELAVGLPCYSEKNSINIESNTDDGISIEVLSSSWNNGSTCPNTTLELEAFDNCNPSYPSTTYQWSIAGATLLSGQGTPTVMVRTQNGSGTTYLTFKVRAKVGSDPYGAWTTITGTSSSSNCGGGFGGGGLFFKSSLNQYPLSPNPIFQNIQGLNIYQSNKTIFVENWGQTNLPEPQLSYQIIGLDGRIRTKGNLISTEEQIDVSEISEKLVLFIIYNNDGSINKSNILLIN